VYEHQQASLSGCKLSSQVCVCVCVLCESGEGEKPNVFRVSGELGCLIYALGSTRYVRKLHDIIHVQCTYIFNIHN